MPVLLANKSCGNIVFPGFVKLASVTWMPGQPAATENVPVALAEPTARDVFVTDSLVHPPEFVSVLPEVVVSCVVESPEVVVSAGGGSAVDSVSAAVVPAASPEVPSPAGPDAGSPETDATTASCVSVPVVAVPESSATAVPAKAPKA